MKYELPKLLNLSMTNQSSGYCGHGPSATSTAGDCLTGGGVELICSQPGSADLLCWDGSSATSGDDKWSCVAGVSPNGLADNPKRCNSGTVDNN